MSTWSCRCCRSSCRSTSLVAAAELLVAEAAALSIGGASSGRWQPQGEYVVQAVLAHLVPVVSLEVAVHCIPHSNVEHKGCWALLLVPPLPNQKALRTSWQLLGQCFSSTSKLMLFGLIVRECILCVFNIHAIVCL